MSAIKVLLVDDHDMVREGLAQLLKSTKDITVVGQGRNGLEAIEEVKNRKPDVVVLDYSMPEMDGASAAERILSKNRNTKVLFLTMHENVHYAAKALEIGAHGFVLKRAATEELVEGIRSVHAGKVYVSPSILGPLTQTLREPRRKRAGLDALSPREFELLRLLGSGKKLQDCAEAMHVSESTVSTHRSRLMEKLKLTNTAEIIRFALENGIVG